MMISILLAAGQGKRLRPLSYFIPKILLPVKGVPVLNYLLENLKNLNLEGNYIIASDHYDIITSYLENTGMQNISVLKGLGWETGGDLSISIKELGNNHDVVAMNGDIVTDADLSQLYSFHLSKKAPVSMALLELADNEEAKRFGQVELRDDQSIAEFYEKNENRTRGSNLVNVGFYIFSKEFLIQHSDLLEPRKFKLETDLFPVLAEEHLLYGCPMNISYWWDVGTIESYLRAERFFINGKGINPP